MDLLRQVTGFITNALNPSDPPATSDSTSKDKDSSSNANNSRTQEIISIAILLRHKLPADLIPLILDHAQLWDTVATSDYHRPDRIGELQAPKLQVALIVPRFLPRGAVRRIRFTTDSRDQGWSSYSEDHGTYENSWTWFEAGIRGLDPGNADDLETIDLNVPVECQHRNALDDEHVRLCKPRYENYKYGSKRIVTNVHASREFKRHVVEWDAGHEDEDVRKMMRELRGGCRVEVSAYAQFSGWVNYVQDVVIEIECAVVRKM